MMMKIVISCLIVCLLDVICGQINEDISYTKYKFGFENGDPGHHTRLEESEAPGHVSGMYSYMDPNGVLRTVRYNSAPGVGYQAYGDGITKFGHEKMPAILEGYSARPPMESTKSDAEFNESGESSTSKNLQLVQAKPDAKLESGRIFQNMQFLEAKPDAKLESGRIFQNMQVLEAKPDEEFTRTATPLPSLQVSNTNSAEMSSSGGDSSNIQTMEDEVDAESSGSGSIPTLESVLIEDDTTNDTDFLFLDVTNSSSVEADNSTFVEHEIIPENPGNLPPPSTSVFVNHNRLFPYLFPFSSYNFPLNSLPFVYAFPQAFTYNVIAPHYQLIV